MRATQERLRIEERLREDEAKYEELLAETREDLARITGTRRDPPVPLAVAMKEPANTRWLLNGLLVPGSTAMLAADASTGKSTLMVQMTLLLSAGRPFLEWRVTRPIPTLYISAEGARDAFLFRVKTAAQSLGVPHNVDWFITAREFNDFDLRSSGLLRQVKSSNAEIVILDTMGYFFSGDENDASDWKRYAMDPLRRMTAETGATFILVHHKNKRTDVDGYHAVRGSSAMTADLDLILLLDRYEPTGDTVPGDENKRVLRIAKNKYGLCGGAGFPLTYHPADAIFSTGF